MAKVSEISDDKVEIIHPDQSTESVDKSWFDFAPQIGDEVTVSANKVYFVARGSSANSKVSVSSSIKPGVLPNVNQIPSPESYPEPFANVQSKEIVPGAEEPLWKSFKFLIAGIISSVTGIIILFASSGAGSSLCELASSFGGSMYGASIFGLGDTACSGYNVAKGFGYVLLLGGAGLITYALYRFFKFQEITLKDLYKHSD
jgi:hypothetical protein